MSVDISNILHVLAHELRTPVGIAHGYVRLLLDDRLPQEADRRRALEQTQKALARLSDLSHESTALAAWYERDQQAEHSIAARTLIDRVASGDYTAPVEIDAAALDDAVRVRSVDVEALIGALTTVVKATARELRAEPCVVRARVASSGQQLEVLTGASEQLAALASGPQGDAAGAIGLERGGLGLALVHAAAVLDAHGAERWTINGSRQTIGLRLPLERPVT
jgi:signal transduction histidine kinase